MAKTPRITSGGCAVASNLIPSICLDSCVVIDLLEKREGRIEWLIPFVREAEDGKLKLVVSTMVIAETLRVDGLDTDEQRQLIRDFFENDFIYAFNVDRRVAERAQDLRRNHKLDGADSVHLATAIVAQCPYLLTNDGAGKTKRKGLINLDQKVIRSDGSPLRIITPADYHKIQIERQNPIFQSSLAEDDVPETDQEPSSQEEIAADGGPEPVESEATEMVAEAAAEDPGGKAEAVQ